MCTMLPAREIAVNLETVRDYQRELEYLYARKLAIDTLIASLEEYARYRAVASNPDRRQTA